MLKRTSINVHSNTWQPALNTSGWLYGWFWDFLFIIFTKSPYLYYPILPQKWCIESVFKRLVNTPPDLSPIFTCKVNLSNTKNPAWFLILASLLHRAKQRVNFFGCHLGLSWFDAMNNTIILLHQMFPLKYNVKPRRVLLAYVKICPTPSALVKIFDHWVD